MSFPITFSAPQKITMSVCPGMSVCPASIYSHGGMLKVWSWYSTGISGGIYPESKATWNAQKFVGARGGIRAWVGCPPSLCVVGWSTPPPPSSPPSGGGWEGGGAE